MREIIFFIFLFVFFIFIIFGNETLPKIKIGKDSHISLKDIFIYEYKNQKTNLKAYAK